MLDRPMNEDALERFGFGQPDCPMLLRVLQRQQSRSQKRRVREAGMVTAAPCGRFTYDRLEAAALADLAGQLADLAEAASAASTRRRPCP